MVGCSVTYSLGERIGEAVAVSPPRSPRMLSKVRQQGTMNCEARTTPLKAQKNEKN